MDVQLQDCKSFNNEETGTSPINSLSHLKYKDCIHPAYEFNTVNIRPSREYICASARYS